MEELINKIDNILQGIADRSKGCLTVHSTWNHDDLIMNMRFAGVKVEKAEMDEIMDTLTTLIPWSAENGSVLIFDTDAQSMSASFKILSDAVIKRLADFCERFNEHEFFCME